MLGGKAGGSEGSDPADDPVPGVELGNASGTKVSYRLAFLGRRKPLGGTSVSCFWCFALGAPSGPETK